MGLSWSNKDTIIIHGRCELKKGGIEIKTGRP